MKRNNNFENAIRNIGYDEFFVHLCPLATENFQKSNGYPAISFDAVGRCCKIYLPLFNG